MIKDVEELGNAYSIRIQGSEGKISVTHSAYRPTNFLVTRRGGGNRVEIVECPVPKDDARVNRRHSFFWEADETSRCARGGKMESELMPLNETLMMMETMQKALGQGDVVYAKVTTDHEPIFLPDSLLQGEQHLADTDFSCCFFLPHITRRIHCILNVRPPTR